MIINKYFFAIFFLISAVTYTYGQTEEDFENFGKLVYQKLIVEEHYNEVSIFWIDTYKRFIDEQKKLSSMEKQKLKHGVDTGYNRIYKNYEDSFLYFEQTYNQAKLDGADFEYLETTRTPIEDGLEDTYHFEVSFIYKTKNMQSEVDIAFDAAWFEGNFYVMSEYEEEF